MQDQARYFRCRTYHTIDANEVFRAFCPRRKHYISEWLPIVIGTEAVAVAVGEHVGHVEKLGN